MKLRMIDAAALAMAAFATPAFSQAVSAAPAEAQAGPAATSPAFGAGADIHTQPAPANPAIPTRQQQAEQAGHACPDRAWPDSVCQTPTSTRPK